LEAAVVTLIDVAESGLALSGINSGLDETSRFAVLLIGDRNEPGPQWSNGTCATDHEGFSIDPR